MDYVVKVGSSSVGNIAQGDVGAVRCLAAEVARLVAGGIRVVLLSSGAVAAGRQVGGAHLSPAAAAALGQPLVQRVWQDALAAEGLKAAQVLVTDRDLPTLGGLLRALLDAGIVPVVNGNDALAAGGPVSDNDTLAAQVAVTLGAERLVLLTDQDGVWTADPRRNAHAVPIRRMTVAEAHRLGAGGAAAGAGPTGRGGMASKVRAAAYAARHAVTTVIAHAGSEDVLRRIARGDNVGTWIEPVQPHAPGEGDCAEASSAGARFLRERGENVKAWKAQGVGYAAAC